MLKALRIKTWVLATVVTLVMDTTGYAASPSKEKLAINKDGIKVWTYQVTNNPMVQYRAEIILNTTTENAVGLILDSEHSKTWMPSIGDVRVIERNNQTGDFVMYTVIDLPFPLTDRDLVIKGHMSKDKDGRMVIKNKSAKDARVPEIAGLVRITKYEGDWIFQKMGKDRVKVTMSGFADPAGAIPTAFVNGFVKQQPYDLLKRMREEVKSTRYSLENLPDVLH